MTYLAVTLFDHPDQAREGMNALVDQGYPRDQVEYIESDPESQRFFKRVFDKDGGEELKAERTDDYLTDLGIEEDDADDYADKVRKGHSLVILRCDTEQEARRAREILDEYPFGEVSDDSTDTGGTETIGGKRPGQPKQPGGEVRSPTADSADTADTTADPATVDDTRSGETVPVNLGDESSTIDEFSANTNERFTRHEMDCRSHFDEHLAESDYNFDDYSRGYRYGMALAEDDTLNDYDWNTIEPEAGRQWERQEDDPWEDFREAVRFGWYKIRGDKEPASRRPER